MTPELLHEIAEAARLGNTIELDPSAARDVADEIERLQHAIINARDLGEAGMLDECVQCLADAQNRSD